MLILITAVGIAKKKEKHFEEEYERLQDESF